MIETLTPLRTILIPISLRDSTDLVVAQGARLAATFGSTVWLLHIFKTSGFLSSSRMPPELQKQKDREVQEVHQALDARSGVLKRQGLTVQAYLLPGTDAAGLILEQAKALQADLIVMGSHGRGALIGALLGNVTNDVLRHAPCPVLVVPTAGLTARTPSSSTNSSTPADSVSD